MISATEPPAVVGHGGQIRRTPQRAVDREVRPAPDRYRNPIGRYRVRRSAACRSCGLCVELCPYGVHLKPEGYGRTLRPRSHLCIGPSCAQADHYCIDRCPNQALSLTRDPTADAIGDPRWTSDLLLSTWRQAETGHGPEGGLEFQHGASGGGFDKLRFRFPEQPPVALKESEIDTGLDLNRRNDGRPRLHIDLPIYGGGMSFGSVSIHVMVARARAAAAWNTFTCTGEGGYPERLQPYDDHVITQVATGLFGVREETMQRVRIVEFKYAQGAKPGLGGHLLGDKNTPDVARMRQAVVGNALFSPFPFHSVYSVEDHKKHLDWIKATNPRALVSVKVSTPTDVDMVAVGSYYAGAHIIHLDGSYGGTGAAPDIAKKNIAMPIEYAVPMVHKFLVAEGIRDDVVLIASGGIRTAHDVLKSIALGADGVVIGTAELVALGCIRCGLCESGRGCARGIATTDRELMLQVDIDWATQRLINLFAAWRQEIVGVLRQFGMRSVAELRGRIDCLYHMDYTKEGEAVGA